jgi:hypothetical protein
MAKQSELQNSSKGTTAISTSSGNSTTGARFSRLMGMLGLYRHVRNQVTLFASPLGRTYLLCSGPFLVGSTS